ncbi:hypothetical protein ACX0G9_15525 [Flavitalea flava]
MRILLTIMALMSFLSPKAQTYLPGSGLGYSPWLSHSGFNQFVDSSRSNHKWHLSKYAGLSAGSVFFAGGGTSFLSAPVGLQLSYPLNNNLYAFAGVSAAPVFFNSSYLSTYPVLNQSYPGSNFSKGYGLGLNSRVEMGLMYINDAKTFSVSGSFGIERSSYPVYPTNRVNTKKQ